MISYVLPCKRKFTTFKHLVIFSQAKESLRHLNFKDSTRNNNLKQNERIRDSFRNKIYLFGYVSKVGRDVSRGYVDYPSIMSE